jgi:hypothetical protein
METFGADPTLIHRNPAYKEELETPFAQIHRYAAPASHEGPYKDGPATEGPAAATRYPLPPDQFLME